MLGQAPNAFAQTSYELITKGGRVIDPSVGIDAVRDVAISAGKIAAVAPNITAGAADTIDARGKIVAPGLIDIHTHAGRSKEGPPMCLQDGVTGWVDAGSGGADNMDELAAVARGAPQIYAPAPNGLLDDKGKLIPEVMQARRRGILFDFGNGVADHFDWATVEAATRQDFWPDTFSTDWSTMSRTTGVIDMPNVMSKLLMFGMPLSATIAAGTVNAARIFPAFDDRGTLNVGAPADAAIL